MATQFLQLEFIFLEPFVLELRYVLLVEFQIKDIVVLAVNIFVPDRSYFNVLQIGNLLGIMVFIA